MQDAEIITILLADDSRSDLDLVRFALEDLQLPVRILYAKDGQEVLDKLLIPSNSPGNNIYPELILLDLELPRVHGLEVLKALRKQPATQNLPIIVFSSSFNETVIQQCYELGANGFVQKPIDFFEFARILEGIIRFWVSP